MVTMTSPLPYQTTHSLSELCETHFEKSGWTGDFTTDIEGLRSALEDVYTLGFEDLSWEELEKVCSDSTQHFGPHECHLEFCHAGHHSGICLF